MGDAPNIIKSLSCGGDCARYVLNNASFHSQCCNEESPGCDCDCETREIPIAQDPDIEISVNEEEVEAAVQAVGGFTALLTDEEEAVLVVLAAILLAEGIP